MPAPNPGNIVSKYTGDMRVDHGDNSVTDVRRRFDAAADSFDDADHVHRATFDGLLERLAPVAIRAGLVLDLGAASGTGSERLAKTFGKARVLSVDISRRMLARGVARRRLFSKTMQVQANALMLPLPDDCVDLVFANMLLPWIDDPAPCFREVNRVLRKDAVFAFASLGPDSMAEFREAAVGVDGFPDIHSFPDMHDVGDALVRAGLRDPVLDVDRLRVTWPTFDELMSDLAGCGAIAQWSPDVASRYQALEARFPRRDESGLFAIELELVFGHAWGSGPRPAAGEFRVEPGTIGHRARS